MLVISRKPFVQINSVAATIQKTMMVNYCNNNFTILLFSILLDTHYSPLNIEFLCTRTYIKIQQHLKTLNCFDLRSFTSCEYHVNKQHWELTTLYSKNQFLYCFLVCQGQVDGQSQFHTGQSGN